MITITVKSFYSDPTFTLFTSTFYKEMSVSRELKPRPLPVPLMDLIDQSFVVKRDDKVLIRSEVGHESHTWCLSVFCNFVLKLSELHRLINTAPEPTWNQLGQRRFWFSSVSCWYPGAAVQCWSQETSSVTSVMYFQSDVFDYKLTNIVCDWWRSSTGSVFYLSPFILPDKGLINKVHEGNRKGAGLQLCVVIRSRPISN